MYSPESQAGSTKITDQAFTVKPVPKSDVDAPEIKGNYINQIPPGAVVFHITASTTCCSWWLDVPASRKSLALQAWSLMADYEIYKNTKILAFAKAVGTTAGGEVCWPSQINVPIQVNSEIQQAVTPINSDDLITADLDGVVCCVRELVQRALEVIPTISAADRKCMEAFKAGMSVEDAFTRFRG